MSRKKSIRSVDAFMQSWGKSKRFIAFSSRIIILNRLISNRKITKAKLYFCTMMTNELLHKQQRSWLNVVTIIYFYFQEVRKTSNSTFDFCISSFSRTEICYSKISSRFNNGILSSFLDCSTNGSEQNSTSSIDQQPSKNCRATSWSIGSKSQSTGACPNDFFRSSRQLYHWRYRTVKFSTRKNSFTDRKQQSTFSSSKPIVETIISSIDRFWTIESKQCLGKAMETMKTKKKKRIELEQNSSRFFSLFDKISRLFEKEIGFVIFHRIMKWEKKTFA